MRRVGQLVAQPGAEKLGRQPEPDAALRQQPGDDLRDRMVRGHLGRGPVSGSAAQAPALAARRALHPEKSRVVPHP